MPSDVVFLEKKEPLARQVADVLLRGKKTRPIDLGDTQVWVPTAGAERRIRSALAHATPGSGVLTPRFLQAMEALLPAQPRISLASRAEREAAWAIVLRKAPEDERDVLLPRPGAAENTSGWLAAGGQLCDLCDLITEGGYDLLDSALAKVCAEDAARWEQLGALYEKYLALLAGVRRQDPNAVRLQTLAWPLAEKSLNRVVVACVPDLSTAATRFLASLSEQGIRVEVLIWKPADLPAGWDAWGRPLKKEWAAVEIPLVSSQIQLAREAADEAILALDYLAQAERPGDFALTLADESLAPTFATEIGQRGVEAFLPGGKPLLASQAGVVAVEWEKWRRGSELRILRTLLQQPRFLRWLSSRARLDSSQLLAACDFLICEPLAETLEEAESFLASPEPPKPRALAHPARAWAETLLSTAREIHDWACPEVLREGWRSAREPADREEVAQVLALHRELANSPLFQEMPEAQEPALNRGLRAARTFQPAAEGAVELSGWLESPWVEATRLAVCGCVEGSLPTSVSGHAFLPDSMRTALGLLDNAGRLARDAYLLSCLRARHGAENLRLHFSKFGADGSPALPSRLLLRTPAESLPEKVLQMFGTGRSGRSQPMRTNGWLWQIPSTLRGLAVEKISPTSFREYLACPFRFYWKQVLRLDDFAPDPREMDARTFGLLLHSTLEAWGKTAPDEEDAAKIESLVLELLERETTRLFGTTRAPTIRVQLESLKVRLRAFARVQAAERADGWRILEVERKFSADEDSTLTIGGLKLSAQIDRVERHPELGLRIMDYKTFTTFKEPEKAHLGSAAANNFLPEAQVTYDGKDKSWIDLQLPLYRFLAKAHYPDATIQTAYFVLPADPGETAIAPLDLSEEDYQSALRCAAAVAERVRCGVFWPPQLVRGGWGDPCSALFLNGAPENCLSPETIRFLAGKP